MRHDDTHRMRDPLRHPRDALVNAGVEQAPAVSASAEYARGERAGPLPQTGVLPLLKPPLKPLVKPLLVLVLVLVLPARAPC